MKCLFPDQFFFLLKKYIVKKNIEQIINERNKGKHLIMKKILCYENIL